MWHIWGTGKVHRGFRSGKSRERRHLKDLGIDGRIILKGSSIKQSGTWTEFILLRKGISEGLF
jgi:hypothetical protein